MVYTRQRSVYVARVHDAIAFKKLFPKAQNIVVPELRATCTAPPTMQYIRQPEILSWNDLIQKEVLIYYSRTWT